MRRSGYPEEINCGGEGRQETATAGHSLLKAWVPRLEPGWAPTVQATHLDGLSDFLVPHSEAQGIFGYQCY